MVVRRIDHLVTYRVQRTDAWPVEEVGEDEESHDESAKGD